MSPLVSIIVPCYNGEKALPDLVANLQALEATGIPLECVFIDDGSEDHSLEIFRRLLPRATILRQANAGVAAARNTGAEAARGDFLQFLDCDDWLDPTTFPERVNAIIAEAGDVQTSAWRMELRRGKETVLEPIQTMDAPDDVCAALLQGSWWGPPHAYLVRRSAYLEIGGSDDSLVNAQDFDVWIRLAITGFGFSHSSALTGHYRRDLTTTSLARGNRARYWRDTETVVRKAIALLEENRQWTPHRKTAAAERLYAVARNVYPIDPKWFDHLIETIFELEPTFRPSGGGLRRFATRLLGLRRSEAAALWLRNRRNPSPSQQG